MAVYFDKKIKTVKLVKWASIANSSLLSQYKSNKIEKHNDSKYFVSDIDYWLLPRRDYNTQGRLDLILSAINGKRHLISK